jgi:hypothetical protein
MNLNRHRSWITPLVIGAFALSAVTGVLMFFHLDSGLNKAAHEWLSWAMLAGVGLHAALNLPAFKRYFSQRTPLLVMAAFALLLGLSFVRPAGSAKEPPFAAPVHALAQAPIPVLAQVLGTNEAMLTEQLRQAGHTVDAEHQTLESLVGGDLRAQIGALKRLMPASGG